MSPTGEFTEFDIPTEDSRPLAITRGSDDNLWFTELRANTIGRISPGGVITELPNVVSNGSLFDLAAATDGTVWFADWSGYIGRVRTDGTINVVPVPTPNGGPIGITVATDGAVWFTENAGNRIGRADAQHLFVVIPILSSLGLIASVVALSLVALVTLRKSL
jgi:virginiamycin B lyase